MFSGSGGGVRGGSKKGVFGGFWGPKKGGFWGPKRGVFGVSEDPLRPKERVATAMFHMFFAIKNKDIRKFITVFKSKFVVIR